MIAWFQKSKEFDQVLKENFQFFRNNIDLSSIRRIHEFYRVSSDNPAIMLSLFSSIYDSIPEIYFNQSDFIELEEIANLNDKSIYVLPNLSLFRKVPRM